MKIEELKKELFIGDLGDCFYDYDNGYICDIITEIADNHIDIYTNDLLEWTKYNYNYIEEALDDFGTPTNNGKADFIKIMQQGQYMQNEEELYNNLEDNLKYFSYVYIQDVLGINEITEEQNELLLDYDYNDSNNKLENIIDHIKEVFKELD